MPVHGAEHPPHALRPAAACRPWTQPAAAVRRSHGCRPRWPCAAARMPPTPRARQRERGLAANLGRLIRQPFAQRDDGPQVMVTGPLGEPLRHRPAARHGQAWPTDQVMGTMITISTARVSRDQVRRGQCGAHRRTASDDAARGALVRQPAGWSLLACTATLVCSASALGSPIALSCDVRPRRPGDRSTHAT